MSTVCQPEVAGCSVVRRRGRIIDLERVRIERLADEIAGQLLAHGGSILRLSTDVGDVNRWRRAARLAGRRRGIVMRTGVSEDRTKVWGSEGP
jgi:hypothetical protein